MSKLPSETEGQALWREFRETAKDLCLDYLNLTWRTPLRHYQQLRKGEHFSGRAFSPLAAAMRVAGHELAKTAGGAAALRYSAGELLLGMAASNIIINTVLSGTLWDGDQAARLPRHTARMQARARQQTTNQP